MIGFLTILFSFAIVQIMYFILFYFFWECILELEVAFGPYKGSGYTITLPILFPVAVNKLWLRSCYYSPSLMPGESLLGLECTPPPFCPLLLWTPSLCFISLLWQPSLQLSLLTAYLDQELLYYLTECFACHDSLKKLHWFISQRSKSSLKFCHHHSFPDLKVRLEFYNSFSADYAL